MARDFNTKPAILSLMQKNMGMVYNAQDIADMFNITREKASQHLSSLFARDHLIESPAKGMYCFRGVKDKTPKREGPELYEFVGNTKAGERIVRDENGVLWKLSTEL